jgi:hypothetical protein
MHAIRPNVGSSMQNTATCIKLPRTAVCLFLSSISFAQAHNRSPRAELL